MTTQEIIEQAMNIKKGVFTKLVKHRDLGNGVTKESDMLIRLNIKYANMKAVEGQATGPLPWGHWVKGLENVVIEHKGNYYLRVANGYTDVISKPKFLFSGKEISKEDAMRIVGNAKAFETKESPVYSIKFDNIVAIGC